MAGSLRFGVGAVAGGVGCIDATGAGARCPGRACTGRGAGVGLGAGDIALAGEMDGGLAGATRPDGSAGRRDDWVGGAFSLVARGVGGRVLGCGSVLACQCSIISSNWLNRREMRAWNNLSNAARSRICAV